MQHASLKHIGGAGFLAALLFFCLWLAACAPSPAVPTSTPIPATETSPPPSAARPKCTTIGQAWTFPLDENVVVCVPAGEFTMGAAESDSEAANSEKPQHNVYLDAFWIDRTEVTNLDYARCVAAGACPPRSTDRGATGVASKTRLNYFYDSAFANYPVLTYRVTEADAYCRWAGRRLPTEAEWEKAARGTDARKYPWGNELSCSHSTFGACEQDTTDVEAFPSGASPYGALNLAGNVWEWVSDWYAADYYSISPDRNPQGPAEGEKGIRRGGGRSSIRKDLRVTARAAGTAHYFDGQSGFRCAIGDATP